MEIVIRDNQKLIKINRRRVERAFRKALNLLKDRKELSSLEVSILFVDDREMRDLNSRYRGIDKTTDVLSFPQYDSHELKRLPAHHGAAPLGDIVVSVSRAKLQAEERGLSLYHEIARLLNHGLLHLLGYDHEKNAYQARKMKRREEELYAAQKMDI